jgi:hypothetical protein
MKISEVILKSDLDEELSGFLINDKIWFLKKKERLWLELAQLVLVVKVF